MINGLRPEDINKVVDDRKKKKKKTNQGSIII